MYNTKIIIILILTFLTCFISCGASYESEDRKELITSFEDNFRFNPPSTIKKIKLKNWGMYDTDVHWMSFTYDPLVMKKIITNDQKLSFVLNNTSEFNNIIEEIKKSVHNPSWLELPNNSTERIYYKKDFIEDKNI